MDDNEKQGILLKLVLGVILGPVLFIFDWGLSVSIEAAMRGWLNFPSDSMGDHVLGVVFWVAFLGIPIGLLWWWFRPWRRTK